MYNDIREKLAGISESLITLGAQLTITVSMHQVRFEKIEDRDMEFLNSIVKKLDDLSREINLRLNSSDTNT